MPQHLRTTLTNAMVRASAPLVAAVFLVVTAVRAQYSTRGPKIRFWSRVRRRYLPTLDRLARSLDVGYAAYELGHREYAGTLRADPREAERVLYRRGFRRNPFAAFKTLPDGRREFSSWCYRSSILATRQVHVMLFDRPGGGTDVYAHAEYSSINPLVANKHYNGEGYDPTRGQARLHERLSQEAWMVSVGPNETPAAADVDSDPATGSPADASADADPDAPADADTTAPADADTSVDTDSTDPTDVDAPADADTDVDVPDESDATSPESDADAPADAPADTDTRTADGSTSADAD